MTTRSLFGVALMTAVLPAAPAQTPATQAAADSPAPQTGEVVQAHTPAGPAKPALVIAEDAAPPPVSKNKDTLSVDFPDEDIRAVLRNVADLFELNLVVPETLQGKTSIKLRDVTWRQIFQVVLSPVGYTFIEEGNIIKVVTADSLNLEPVTTDVFILNYAKAEDIKKSVDPLVEAAAGGRVIVDSRSNALIISERPTRLSRVRPIIEQLDRATDQVMIESKFIEVTDRDVKNLGVNWASLNGYSVGAGNLRSSVNRSRNGSYSDGNAASGSRNATSASSASSGTSSNATVGSNMSNTVTSTDGVVSTVATTGTNTVLNNGTTAGTSTTTGSDSNSLLSTFQNLAAGGATDRLATAVFSADDFRVVLSALQTLTNTKIVSNPTVVTLNNSESTINVGDDYPIPKYTYNQERGTFEVSGFEFRPIGINLRVTPQVNSRGFIRLNLEPEVSQRNGSVNFNSAEIPIISTRKTKTQVSLKDGYTMGIGGLIRAQASNGNTKVPLLGDLPVIGAAFRSKTRDNESTNLLIFITAKTVAADGAPINEVFDSRVIRSLGIKKDELPGYRDPSDPFAAQPAAPAKKPFFNLSKSKKDDASQAK